MRFMNEYDIENALRRFAGDGTPNLLAGAKTIDRLRRWTNRNSDGWAYWHKPVTAAKKLIDLLEDADHFNPVDCTEAQLRAAYTPIKAFLTRQKVDHAAVFPPPPDTPQTFRIEVRFDFTGTADDAKAEAQRVAALVGGDVTDIADEHWETI